MVLAIVVSLVLGGACTAMVTHFGRDDLRHWPLVGTLVCGDGLTADVKPAGRSNRVACLDASGVEVGQASQFAALKLMAPIVIAFAGIGLYLVSRADRKSMP
ncbi:MAG TPA: hypothetical protein VJR58_14590 [Vineibacter sp.]|nr:hypothetical protein [Vineibacter sp.]